MNFWKFDIGFGGQQAGGCFSEVRFTRGGDFCCLLEERLERDVLMIFCGKIFWIYIETLTISDIRSQWRAKKGVGRTTKKSGWWYAILHEPEFTSWDVFTQASDEFAVKPLKHWKPGCGWNQLQNKKKNKSNDKISRMKPSPPKRRFTNQRIQPPKKTSESCFSPWMLLQFFGSALSTSPSPPRLAHSQWMPCSVEDAELGPQRLRKADHLWGGRKDNFPQSSGREIHVARSKAWSQY